MSTWPASITPIKEGPATPEVFNTPLTQLEKRTNYLKQRIEEATAGETTKVYLPVEGLEAEQVVAWNSEGNLVPAIAKWNEEKGPNGELEASLISHPYGIILNIEDGVAEILTGGSVDASELGLPENAIIWLSCGAPGEITTDRPPIGVRIGFSGGGIFTFSPAVPLGDAHTHARISLTAGWLPYDDVVFEGLIPPAGASLGYDIDTDPCVAEALAYPAGDAICFVDGAIEFDLVSYSGNIWWVGDVGEVPATAEAFLLAPVTFDTPVLRALTTDTPEYFDISSSKGLVTINMKPLLEEGGPYGDCDDPRTYEEEVRWTIGSINGRTYRRSRNVSRVVAGPGISVVTDSKGRALVAADVPEGLKLRPVLVDMDRSLHVVDGGLQKLVFPANKESSVIGGINIPNYETVSLAVRPFVEAFIKGGISTTEFSVDIRIVPDPEGGNTTVQGPYSTTIAPISGAAGDIAYGTAVSSIAISSGARIFVQIETTAGASDVELIGFGVVLEAV